MNYFHTLVLSLVEGISEFLPISSTGHLVLASTLLRIPETDFIKSFEIFIQLGAILAVFILYGRSLLVNKKILIRIFTAFLPTALIGFVLYKIIKHYLLGNVWIVVASLFFGGIALIIIELTHKEKEQSTAAVEHMSLKQSFIIGAVQSLSIIPGVSRAAATIVGGQLVGLKRQTAVEFSFLLAIPTMIAATGLDLVKSNALRFSYTEITQLGIGFIGSFITAMLVVRLFLQFIQKNTFIPFGIYRIAIAIVMTIFMIR